MHDPGQQKFAGDKRDYGKENAAYWKSVNHAVYAM
jgi:hypothetical protein